MHNYMYMLIYMHVHVHISTVVIYMYAHVLRCCTCAVLPIPLSSPPPPPHLHLPHSLGASGISLLGASRSPQEHLQPHIMFVTCQELLLLSMKQSNHITLCTCTCTGANTHMFSSKDIPSVQSKYGLLHVHVCMHSTCTYS